MGGDKLEPLAIIGGQPQRENGSTFEISSGAPDWIQVAGLQWVYRLGTAARRLSAQNIGTGVRALLLSVRRKRR
jgi:UDP-N-acetyl-D-mannosaminuronic acid transferase (WecB/TagA/CpsF family)